jgi:hypothetical protein
MGTTEARLLLPVRNETMNAWACRFEIGPPFSVRRDVHGETSLQALSLALKTLSSHLYGSKLYKDGKLGCHGEFGGYLGVPAPKVMLKSAPYRF